MSASGYNLFQVAWNQNGTKALAVGTDACSVILTLSAGNTLSVTQQRKTVGSFQYHAVINLRDNIFLVSLFYNTELQFVTIQGDTFTVIKNITGVNQNIKNFYIQYSILYMVSGQNTISVYDYNSNFDAQNI